MVDRARGPSPDDPEEQMEQLLRLVADAAAKATIEVKYQEGKGSDKQLLKWLIGINTTLLAAFLIGCVAAYGKLQAISDHQESSDHRLDRIENRIDGRSGLTRGSANDANPP